MSVRLEILKIKNLTAEVDILGSRGPVEVTECGLHSVVFVLGEPVRQEVLVSLELRLSFGGKLHLLSVTGKVSACEGSGESYRMTVQLRQHDQAVWGPLMEALHGHQDRVDRLFKSMKGVA